MITEKWAECIPLLQVLCFGVMFWPIQTLNFTMLRVKGRSDLLLRLNIVIKILGLIVMVFTVPNGIMAIGYGSLVHALLCFFWITYYTGKVSSVSMRTQIRSILPILLLSGMMYLIIIVVIFFLDSYLTQLIVGTFVGMTFYLTMAYFLKFSGLYDIKFLLHMNNK